MSFVLRPRGPEVTGGAAEWPVDDRTKLLVAGLALARSGK